MSKVLNANVKSIKRSKIPKRSIRVFLEGLGGFKASPVKSKTKAGYKWQEALSSIKMQFKDILIQQKVFLTWSNADSNLKQKLWWGRQR